MRIVSGSARGIRLEAPDGDEVRATLDRVKENFINAIHFRLPGARVLDLFAGSGQLGLEALSRGAEEAVFIDISQDCLDVIKRNAQKARFMSQCNIYRHDYAEYLNILKKRPPDRKFGVVFLDPPYREGILPDAVRRLLSADCLGEGAVVVCESGEPLSLPGQIAERFEEPKRFKYGKVFVTLLTLKSSGNAI